MSAIILFNRGQLARKLDRDVRTVKSYLANLRIMPDAFSPSGLPLYGERALQTLEAQEHARRELLAEARAIVFNPSASITSTTI